MSKHTPGPWWIDHGDDVDLPNHVGISSERHGLLAQVVWKMEDDECTPRCEATARLIAAAPDLLAELQNIANANPREWDEETRDQFQQWAQSRARFAIAKVEGTS